MQYVMWRKGLVFSFPFNYPLANASTVRNNQFFVPRPISTLFSNEEGGVCEIIYSLMNGQKGVGCKRATTLRPVSDSWKSVFA